MQRDSQDNGGSSGQSHATAQSLLARGREVPRRIWSRLGLPAKLLLLTTVFVMLAEVLIFVPSVANFRVNWLKDRLVAAKLAGLAAEAVPGGQVPAALRQELLQTAKVKAVAWRRKGLRKMVLPPDELMVVDRTFDLRTMQETGLWQSLGTRLGAIGEALAVMVRGSDRTIRIVGPLSHQSGEFIEIVLPESPLRDAMLRYGSNILILSIIISLFTAALVYIALSGLLVRPMMRITHNMLKFSENPEDASRIIVPSERNDEVGTAERELAAMQRELSHLILQKNRLAQLGLAVSKVNHDLRNMLASAQLISDRLSSISDPTVQKFAPKLIASLDRAINFCTASLQFGRAEEEEPRRNLLPLKPLVEDVGDGLGLPREGVIDWVISIDETLLIDADRDHLYRVLSNLCRNAMQVLESQPDTKGSKICVSGRREHRCVTVEVSDNGPGVPKRARETLFKAFQGSQRKGGTGLGLAIAHELVAAHGGTLELVDGAAGAKFRIEIPDRSVG